MSYTLKRLTEYKTDGELDKVSFAISLFENGNGITKNFELDEEELKAYIQDPEVITKFAEQYASTMEIPNEPVKEIIEIQAAVSLSEKNIEEEKKKPRKEPLVSSKVNESPVISK